MKKIIILLIAAMSIGLLTGCSNGRIAKSAVIGEFNANKSIYYAIAAYMRDSSDDVLNIDKDKNNDFVVANSKDDTAKAAIEKEITDKKLDATFKQLFTLGYETVLNDANGVFFIRYADDNYESGIVFSMDGNEPTWSDISELEKVEGDYYYYEGKF